MILPFSEGDSIAGLAVDPGPPTRTSPTMDNPCLTCGHVISERQSFHLLRRRSLSKNEAPSFPVPSLFSPFCPFSRPIASFYLPPRSGIQGVALAARCWQLF